MRKAARLAALLLAAALAVSLPGCGEVPQTEPESPAPTPSPVTVPEAEPAVFALGCAGSDTLHPLETRDQSNLDVGKLVYEGLYELDGAFEPQPLLARSATVSEDGLTWTVTLRDTASFSNGAPLTAAEVVASLRKAQKGGVYAARLSGVVSVAERDGAVVITLAAPNGALPALLDVPIVLEGDGLPLGTGPYVFDTDGEDLWLAANPNWWQGRRPAYDTIPLRSCQSLDERVSAFDSGLVTAVTTDFTAANALGYSGTYETHDFPTTEMLFVGFNVAGGPCTSAALRAALSRAFDRGSVVASLLSGHAQAACLPISPRSGQYSKTAAGLLDYDLEAARALLEQAGYTYNDKGMLVRGRRTLSLTFLVNQDSLAKQAITDHIAQDLRELGMDVTVKKLDWDDYLAALAAGSFDLYLGEVRLTGDFDFSPLVTGALNYGGYQNGEVAGLLSAWRAANGDREAAADTLFQAMAADLPFAALCFKTNSLLVRWGMAENLAPAPWNPFAGVENWRSSK